MTKGLEYVREELKLSEDHLTTYDRVMLKQVEKELKALEIIKKKRIDVAALLFQFNAEDYNRKNVFERLTETEIMLLREVFKNE